MTNLIVIIVLAIIIGVAVAYIVKEKKKGVKCVGCPDAGKCAARNNGGCGCAGHSDTKEDKTK